MSPRWQQLRRRFAFWLEPAIPKLLRRSGNVIERLEIRAEQNQEWKRVELARRDAICAELEEAAALGGGAPWRGGVSAIGHAGQQLAEASRSIREAYRETALKETIYGRAELEIALDDRGWKRLVAQSQYEFSRFGIQSIILICRLYYIKNPLARRGVDVSAFYVFGRGLEISSPDEVANETLNDFFNDPRNATQFSHTALVKKEKATYTDGNIFLAFFADPQDGRLESRGIDAVEISDIITDPNDNDVPWFYRRDWAENAFDPDTGRRETKQRTQWYFAMGYEDIPGFPVKQRRIESEADNVALDSSGNPIPVLHLKDGDLPGWRFGCPRMYSAVDWLRAYRQGLEDLCTLWRALSRFAWNVETEGGAPAIAAFKQTLATTLMNDLTQIESNPPPVTGSAFISGPTNKISPMQTGGSTMNPDNLRRVLLMVCAGFGLNENMMGDACYSADTEVLTEHGFMLHQGWAPGTRVACYNPETSRIEWREPFELHTYYRQDPLIRFQNGQTDIAVTPNHRMWASPIVGWNAKNPVVDRSWRIEPASFLAEEHREKGWKFKVRFDVEELHVEVPEFIPIKSEVNWAAFIGYWVAEGCTIEWTGPSGHVLVDGTPGAPATIRRVMLSQNEGPVLEDMKATLRALGLHFYEGAVKGKQKSISIYNKPLWTYLRETCGLGSHSKKLPREFINAPEPVRRALYNAMMAGDGGKSGSSFRYSTTSTQLADDMQILATTLGFAANITVEDREFNGKDCPINRVWIRAEWTESSVIKPKHISTEPYCGLVYCFNLPHGIYVTRRNGKIAVQGNSTGSFATANSLQRDIELMFIERQEVWREVLQRIGRYVLARSLRAPKGKLREAVAKRQDKPSSDVDISKVLIESPIGRNGKGITRMQEAKSEPTDAAQKITVGVTFPAILQGDVGMRIKAIVDAMTLDGKEPIGADQKTCTRLLLVELGVEDPDIVIEAMFPEATYEIDRTIQPALPTTIKADAPPPQSDVKDRAGIQQEEPAGISKDPEVIERAANQLLLAARKRLAARLTENSLAARGPA